MVEWCSGYHYCTSSFNEALTQVLPKFKPCSRRVGDSRWWGFLKIVTDRNKAQCLLLVNNTTKTFHQDVECTRYKIILKCCMSYHFRVIYPNPNCFVCIMYFQNCFINGRQHSVFYKPYMASFKIVTVYAVIYKVYGTCYYLQIMCWLLSHTWYFVPFVPFCVMIYSTLRFHVIWSIFLFCSFSFDTWFYWSTKLWID